MKKLIFCIICLLTLTLSLPALGASVPYTVGPANLTISIPDSMYVFTRDSSPDNASFAALGFEYDTVMATFNEQNIYLQAIGNAPGNQKEIVVISTPTQESAYSDATALYNAAMAESNSLEAEGKTVISEDIFESAGTDYIMVEYSGIFTSREYITVSGGQKIRIRLTDYEGDISASEEEAFEDIIKTVSFPKEKEEPEKLNPEPAPTEPVQETEEATSEVAGGISKEMKESIIKWLIIICAVLLLVTVPALIMRLFLFRKGLSKGASKAFAIIYSVVVAVLILYLIHKKLLGDITPWIAVVPLLWSWVIYKIVKH